MSGFSDNFRCRTTPTPAQRRYVLLQIIAMVVYIAAIFAVPRFIHTSHTSLVLISLLTSIFLLAVIMLAGLYLKQEKDEFQRVLLQRGMLWSVGATLAFTSIWGCLEMFLHVRHFPLFYVFDIFALFTAVFTTALRIKYRIGNE